MYKYTITLKEELKLRFSNYNQHYFYYFENR